MDLSDYNDLEEFYKACLKLHQDEEDPELILASNSNKTRHYIAYSELCLSEQHFLLSFELLFCQVFTNLKERGASNRI